MVLEYDCSVVKSARTSASRSCIATRKSFLIAHASHTVVSYINSGTTGVSSMRIEQYVHGSDTTLHVSFLASHLQYTYCVHYTFCTNSNLHAVSLHIRENCTGFQDVGRFPQGFLRTVSTGSASYKSGSCSAKTSKTR
jgi:hypothetical protein